MVVLPSVFLVRGDRRKIECDHDPRHRDVWTRRVSEREVKVRYREKVGSTSLLGPGLSPLSTT